jgi:pyruvate dehydrogenase E2 component (dihydrolipoamide acetyltransferase)
MPRLGWTMETGTLAEWIKHDGDEVREGEVVFAVETDKVAQEVEAVDSGILRIPPDGVAIGDVVPVGAVLAYLVQPGEAAPFEQGPAARPVAPVVETTAPSPAGIPGTLAGIPGTAVPANVPGTISPRARRIAGELGIDWTSITGSGRTGRIVERDVCAVAMQPVAARARITPVARRVAQQAGVDLDDVATQVAGKRITRADVEAARQPVEAEATAVQPISKVRRVIAERMAHSAHTSAPVTLTTEVDATELAALRERIKRDIAGGKTPSYTDLLTRLVALALLEHPQVNSSFAGEGIVRHQAVHIGIAVDTEQGLLVPVVRDAHLKSVQRIATESAALIERARSGKAGPDDLGGGTFSISNLGMYEIDAFTPIINLPECAVLGVGRIVARQVVVDEEREIVAIRKMMVLSLTFDHRLVDGAPAARFLQQIKRWIEQPYGWMTA